MQHIKHAALNNSGVSLWLNCWDEYQVEYLATDGKWCTHFTDDKQDAIDTAFWLIKNNHVNTAVKIKG